MFNKSRSQERGINICSTWVEPRRGVKHMFNKSRTKERGISICSIRVESRRGV